MKLLDWTKILAAIILPFALTSCADKTPKPDMTGDASINDPNSEDAKVVNDIMDPGSKDGKSLGDVAENSRIDSRGGFQYGKFSAIYFDYDSTSIQSSDRSTLEEVAKYIKDHPGKQIRIEGHCDERGTREYNRALGQRRASAAREYLVKLGVAPKSLGTISYGEEKPAETGHDDGAWSKNRRDEFGIAQ
jgi:peptidoglycan-associated lipoprotein